MREQDVKKNPEKYANINLPFTNYRCNKIAQKIIRIIKNITPEFKINFCWSNINLDRFFSPKLKMSKPILEKNDLIYNFSCECSDVYIGETKRMLQTRANEHFNKGTIKLHIDKCELYQNNLLNILNEKPTHNKKEKSEKFFHQKFSIIHNNLSYWNDRKTSEALYIKLNKPKLNSQVKHKKIQII